MRLEESMNLESPYLRESTVRFGQRMTELNRGINGVMIRSALSLLLFLVGLAQMLALSKARYLTGGFAWIPFLLCLVMFAVSVYYMYNRLRLLWTYSAEMEMVMIELKTNGQRMLELGMEDDAYLALKAGLGAVPARTTRIWGIMNTLLFVFLSVPLMYAEYAYVIESV